MSPPTPLQRSYVRGERDVYFLPIRRKQKLTYLWVWPTKAERHPPALLSLRG